MALLLTACTVRPEAVSKSEVSRVAVVLEQMDGNISRAEAMKLSRALLRKTAQLTKAFAPLPEPHLNNFLVHAGVKEQGLCYHWSDALYLAMRRGTYPGFAFHAAGANIGRYWSEHNVLVITAKGRPFETGVVVDPWRNPGRLYVAKVTEDGAYVWRERKERCIIDNAKERE